MALGWPSVEWGLSRMSAREFTEWRAFYENEPFGERRADLLVAMLCKVIADVNTPKGKPRAKLKDFIPQFWEGADAQTDEEMLRQVEYANFAYGGVDERDG